MKQIALPFYKKYRCLADKCPLNCCKPYRIGFFKWEAGQFDTNPLWKDVDGKGNSIREYLSEDEYGLILKRNRHGSCIFFEDSMCALQKRNGAMAQPSICRTFPRLITRVGNHLELSMDPCCIAVPYLAKDWQLCEFEVKDDNGEPSEDIRCIKREKVFCLLSDAQLTYSNCLEKMAGVYGFSANVPEFHLSEAQENFFRKMTALLVWGYMIPYDGYPTIPNMMEFIISLIKNLKTLFEKENVSDDWEEMSFHFARLLQDTIVEQNFDMDLEDSYLDMNGSDK